MDEPKVERRVRMPPNGSSDEYGEFPPEFTTRRKSDYYVYRWCMEKHEKIERDRQKDQADMDKRIEQLYEHFTKRDDEYNRRTGRLENWFITILIGIIVQLVSIVGGFTALYFKLLS